MERHFTIERVTIEPDGLPLYPPQFKSVRHQMSQSIGPFPWRPMGTRLLHLRAN